MKYGLIGGAAVVAYFLIFYIFKKELFLNPIVQWSSLGVYVFFMYKASTELQAAQSGPTTFRNAVRTPFLVFILINLCYYLFYYGLHLYDPELLRMEAANQIAYLKAQINAGVGDPQQANQIREQIQYLENQGMLLPLGPVFLQMAMGAIGGFGLAAAITAWRRR